MPLFFSDEKLYYSIFLSINMDVLEYFRKLGYK